LIVGLSELFELGQQRVQWSRHPFLTQRTDSLARSRLAGSLRDKMPDEPVTLPHAIMIDAGIRAERRQR
jgi:hypothetical protein